MFWNVISRANILGSLSTLNAPKQVNWVVCNHLVLLFFVILSCALSSVLEVIFENKLVKFCRTFFTMLQVFKGQNYELNNILHPPGHLADTPWTPSINLPTTNASSTDFLLAHSCLVLSPPTHAPCLLSM